MIFYTFILISPTKRLFILYLTFEIYRVRFESMITIEQIKAARALLDWNQEELAEAASLSKPSLANYERGIGNPRLETLNSIRTALEEAGIEFMDSVGVRLKQDSLQVKVLLGTDSIYLLFQDIFHSLTEGEERLMYAINESRLTREESTDDFEKWAKKFKKKGITAKIIVLDKEETFVDPTAEYRTISEEHAEDFPYYVYGNKYAFILWEPTPRVIVMENKIVADNYRGQFQKVWAKAKKTTKELTHV